MEQKLNMLTRTIRIFSSEEYFLGVLRRMSLTTDSPDTFLFITTPLLRKV